MLPRLLPLRAGRCQVCANEGWHWVYLILFDSGGSIYVCGVCRYALWRLESARVMSHSTNL